MRITQTFSKRLLLIAAIALICPLTGAPRASAQSAQFSYSNFSGVGMTYMAGSSFTFDIILNFTSGGTTANLNGLSYWMNQKAPTGPPFVFAITLRDTTGSSFTELQTPGITYPQNLTPFNTNDLGALSTGPYPTGAYFIAHLTMSISGSAAAGVYTIGNTTATTPGVGGKISVMTDDQGTLLPIASSAFNITVTPSGTPSPTLNPISPNPVTGSTSPQTFTLTGANFMSGAKVQVAYASTGYTFVNTNTNATFISSTQLTVPITTSTTADTWRVRVQNPNGQTSGQMSLTVNAPGGEIAPVVNSISPNPVAGSASPRTFTLIGGNFITGSEVQVAYASNGYTFVNTNTGATFVSSTQLTVPITTSTTADTWRIRVRNPDGQTSNQIDLSVNAGFSAGMTVSDSFVSGTSYEITLDGTATGGLAPFTYRWDTNNDGIYGDHVAQHVAYTTSSQGETYRLGLEVTDSNGAKAYAAGIVILVKPPVPGEPPIPPPPDTAPSNCLSANLTPVVFDSDWQARSAIGLIVITHGIRSSTDPEDHWLTNMAHAIQNKLGTQCPNIVLYDWRDDADPFVDGSEREEIVDFIDRSIASLPWWITIPDSTIRAVLLGDDFITDAIGSRLIGGPKSGRRLSDWILSQTGGSQPHINPSQPIHFIGHSAGGFCMGEAAMRLKDRNIVVDRVTTLDTPAPIYQHIIAQRFPGYLDRYVSSIYGLLEAPLPLPPIPDQDHYWNGAHIKGLQYLLSPGDNGHGYSHVWYQETIDQGLGDGFDRSPFESGPQAGRGGHVSPVIMSALPDQPITGFSTFGNVSETTGGYQITEIADAGLTKDMSIPFGAVSLKFRYKFVSAGDGDVLSVNLANSHSIYVGEDLALSRSEYVEAEIPLDFLTNRTGSLTFTLFSRGGANAVIDIQDIRFGMSDDPDGDGLTTDEETALGTDPLNGDTDHDGLSDGDEVSIYHTNPLLADTDGDGTSDRDEIAQGTDPLDPSSHPPPPTPIGISGSVFYCSNPVPGPVPNVTLILTGSAGSFLSDGSGNYQFSTLASGGTYTVTPNKAALMPGSAGFSTVDVIATQRQFLNLGTPLSGCRLTAADVNGDTNVTTVDVIAVQRFFLGLSTGIANVGKYQFTPANRTYSGVVTDQTAQNYDTLIFGDVASPFAE